MRRIESIFIHPSLMCAIALTAVAAPTAVAEQPYAGEIARWTAQDRLDPPEAGAILFIGSSSIRRWEQLTRDFDDYRVIQRGYGGCHFDHVNQYADEIVLPYKPSAIVVWAGANDLNSGQPADELVEDFEAFIEKVHGEQPGVEVFYLGVTSTIGNEASKDARDEANARISELCAQGERLHFIDLPSAFYDLGGPDDEAFSGMYVDDLHLNRKGYRFWTSLIRPNVEAVVKPNKAYQPNPDAPGAGASILFDFGPSNAEDGAHTTGADTNGNHWNNWHEAKGNVAVNAGEHLAGLVDSNGEPTGVGMVITGGFATNGVRNGGLAEPDADRLGDLAVATATQDFFFSSADDRWGGGNDDAGGGFMLTGLNPEGSYDFRFFGSRVDPSETRATEFRVFGSNRGKATLTTTGEGVGSDGAYAGNDGEIAEVSGISPDRFGQVFIDMTVVEGTYAYLNAMEMRVRSLGARDHDNNERGAHAAAREN